MRIETSSFFGYRGEGQRISIARAMPRGLVLPVYSPLAPGVWFKEADVGKYRKLYFAQLAQLDPVKVLADLRELAGEKHPVMCCWETLKRPGEFCHRRMVAEWLWEEVKINAEEFGTRNSEKDDDD